MIYLFEIILRFLYLNLSILFSLLLLFLFSDYLMLFFFNLGIITLDSSYTLQYIINYSYKAPNELFIFLFNLISFFLITIIFPYFFWLILDFFKTLIKVSTFNFLMFLYKFYLCIYILFNLFIFIKLFPLFWFFFLI